MKEILITSSVLIVVLLILRVLFANKVRRTLIYGTWLLVALRLLLPFQIGELSVSVLNLFQPVTQTITDISDKQVAGMSQQDAHQQVMQEYIAQDHTVFLPVVQEQIESALDNQIPEDQIATMIEKDHTEIYVPEVQPQVQEKVEQTTKSVTLGQVARAIWLAGAVAVALWLTANNLHFIRSMKKAASPLPSESPIPVYVTEKAISPCLVGLFRPAVYLTREAADNEALRHYVMTHEMTHYAHRDHIWSAVRCLCLCLYWFNPLVWVAAWCSRRDCELACDEGAMARLGEDQRISYGKALLAVVREASVPSRLKLTATTMAETKRQLRRRVDFIARKPHLSLFAAISLVLVCTIVVGCVSTGALPEKPTEDPIIDTPVITAPTESISPTDATETVSTAETTATQSTDPTKKTGATKITRPPPPTATKPATQPTEETKQLGSTPTTKPIAQPATKATTKPTAKPATQPTARPEPNPTSTTADDKVLQIYGLGMPDSFSDYTKFDENDYRWMMRAAAEEWAALNGYTLEFKGSTDYNSLIAATGAGSNDSDIIFYNNNYFNIVSSGLAVPFTDGEYQKLANICGAKYLDLLTYQNASHGFVLPWAANTVCYYNATRFENYGVKSPGEYFREGNWNWDTFMNCLEEMTCDGKMDFHSAFYGMPGASWEYLVNPWATNAKGELISTIDEPFMRAFFQMKYEAFSVKKVSFPRKNDMLTSPLEPLFSMQLSMCRTYDFTQLYQLIHTGDRIEVVPVPAYQGNSILQFEQAYASLSYFCDQREAAVDMLTYILKCGMKYISDFSAGFIKCDYPGIQGSCQQSQQWLTAFREVCTKRDKELLQLRHDYIYDEKDISKLYEAFRNAQWYIDPDYRHITALTEFEEFSSMAPEQAIPIVKPKYLEMLDGFNRSYFS